MFQFQAVVVQWFQSETQFNKINQILLHAKQTTNILILIYF